MATDRDWFFDMVERKMRERFASGDVEEHNPILFIFSGEECAVLNPPSSTFVAGMVTQALADDDTIGVGFVSEAWVADIRGDAAKRFDGSLVVPVSEMPDRTEAIIATWYSRSARPAMLVIPVTAERVLGVARRSGADDDLGGTLGQGLGGNAN